MKREYHPYWYRLDGIDHYLLWFCDEVDGFFQSADQTIPSFSNQGDLMMVASQHGIQISVEDPTLLDLTVVTDWLQTPKPEGIDCPTFLNAWNLFQDVAETVGHSFETTTDGFNTSIYNKLFWGNNLPSVTPPGECYVAEWSAEELSRIHEILSDGFFLFQQHIKMV